MMRIIEIDREVRAFTVESDDDPFDDRELHNTRVWIGGRPVVIVIDEPDEETMKLLE